MHKREQIMVPLSSKKAHTWDAWIEIGVGMNFQYPWAHASKLLILPACVLNKLGLVSVKAHPSLDLPWPLFLAQILFQYKFWLHMISHMVGPSQGPRSTYDIFLAQYKDWEDDSGLQWTVETFSKIANIESKFEDILDLYLGPRWNCVMK